MAVRKIKFKPNAKLTGIKYGFYFPVQGIVWVSPAIYKLCESDLPVLRDNLHIWAMNVDDKGHEIIDNLEDWLSFLLAQGVELTVKKE